MKNVITLVFISLSTLVYSQNVDGIINKLSDEICKNLSKKDSTQISTAELGIAIIQSENILNAAEKKVFDASFYGDEKYDKLGEKLGVNLTINCPAFAKYLENSGYLDGEEEVEEEASEYYFDAYFQKLKTEQFNTLIVKDDENKIWNLIWLDYFEGSNLLQENKIATGQLITVQYKEVELFDPKIQDYRSFMQITSIKIAEK